MPKANSSQRTRRARNRATVLYDDDPCEGEAGHNIMISKTVTGRVLRSTALASELDAETTINSDFADPWTTGFFDSNSEAFVVDSPPDELLDLDPLESQPKPKDRHMVRMPFTFECLHIDKGS